MADGTRTSWPGLAQGLCLAEGLPPMHIVTVVPPFPFSGHLVTVREACCIFSC